MVDVQVHRRLAAGFILFIVYGQYEGGMQCGHLNWFATDLSGLGMTASEGVKPNSIEAFDELIAIKPHVLNDTNHIYASCTRIAGIHEQLALFGPVTRLYAHQSRRL